MESAAKKYIGSMYACETKVDGAANAQIARGK
jgi:hypothetical protein